MARRWPSARSPGPRGGSQLRGRHRGSRSVCRPFVLRHSPPCCRSRTSHPPRARRRQPVRSPARRVAQRPARRRPRQRQQQLASLWRGGGPSGAGFRPSRPGCTSAWSTGGPRGQRRPLSPVSWPRCDGGAPPPPRGGGDGNPGDAGGSTARARGSAAAAESKIFASPAARDGGARRPPCSSTVRTGSLRGLPRVASRDGGDGLATACIVAAMTRGAAFSTWR